MHIKHQHIRLPLLITLALLVVGLVSLPNSAQAYQATPLAKWGGSNPQNPLQGVSFWRESPRRGL